jgi:uncharacterized membrane protein
MNYGIFNNYLPRPMQPVQPETSHSDASAAQAPALEGRASLAMGAAACLLCLIALCVAWELWLAPLRPGGSWLVLKVVPLLFAVAGVLKRRLYTMQWLSLLMMLYFTEGIVRMTDKGLSSQLAMLEIALSMGIFACCVAYVRPFKRAAKQAQAKQNELAKEPSAS